MIKYVFILALCLSVAFGLAGVTELTDSNFAQEVQAEPNFWIVLFAADWCGHCQKLKPEFEKLAPLLAEYGVKLGSVDAKNNKLVNDYVVDHKTHMVSYPKLKVFLGQQNMGDVPPGLRTANEIKHWMVKQFNLANQPQL